MKTPLTVLLATIALISFAGDTNAPSSSEIGRYILLNTTNIILGDTTVRPMPIVIRMDTVTGLACALVIDSTSGREGPRWKPIAEPLAKK